ncbi:MAG: SDR family oxidoreductase [Spirochaetaceae bacterium]|nr:MAG: SDR family oxidoreductase [Spirochaetaceae bacterium]
MKVLVVGSTGLVGGTAVKLLSEKGADVRALVRESSDQSKVAALRTAGVETVVGDLRDADSLRAACAGVDTVLATASAVPFAWGESNTTSTVDRDGTIRLIDAARHAGVSHCIHTSFPHGPDPGFPLGDAKAAAEKFVIESGMTYSILAANYFMEAWLSPALGFDYAAGTAVIYGEGTNPVSFVSFFDVARTACEAVFRPEARNRILPIGGPRALSALDAVRIFETKSGRTWNVQHISAADLEAQFAAAGDEFQKSLAALQLTIATSPDLAMDPSTYLVKSDLKSVERYAEDAVKHEAPV